MSAPPTSLPAEIAELMWTETICSYEKSLGQTGRAQQVYDTAVDLTCWVEPHSYMGLEAQRPTIGQTTLTADTEPVYDVYFDGDSAVAQAFSLSDRFTINLPGGPTALKPREIATFEGPNFLNANPWLITVRL